MRLWRRGERRVLQSWPSSVFKSESEDLGLSQVEAKVRLNLLRTDMSFIPP